LKTKCNFFGKITIYIIEGEVGMDNKVIAGKSKEEIDHRALYVKCMRYLNSAPPRTAKYREMFETAARLEKQFPELIKRKAS
jgi:hypothetical protein